MKVSEWDVLCKPSHITDVQLQVESTYTLHEEATVDEQRTGLLALEHKPQDLTEMKVADVCEQLTTACVRSPIVIFDSSMRVVSPLK